MEKEIRIEKKGGEYIIDEVSYQKLNSKGYGVRLGKSYLIEEYEALYLLEKNKVLIFSKGKEMRIEDFQNKKDIYLNYLVYKDLRSRGYIVKSGLKYGFVFRVYDKGIKEGEDHSLWLVEPIKESDKIAITSIAGKNRVAHSAKKKMLFAIVDSQGGITYLENYWKRL